jgi:hypothetical protein
MIFSRPSAQPKTLFHHQKPITINLFSLLIHHRNRITNRAYRGVYIYGEGFYGGAGAAGMVTFCASGLALCAEGAGVNPKHEGFFLVCQKNFPFNFFKLLAYSFYPFIVGFFVYRGEGEAKDDCFTIFSEELFALGYSWHVWRADTTISIVLTAKDAFHPHPLGYYYFGCGHPFKVSFGDVITGNDLVYFSVSLYFFAHLDMRLCSIDSDWFRGVVNKLIITIVVVFKLLDHFET